MKRFARQFRALLVLGLFCALSTGVLADGGTPEQRLATQLTQAVSLALRQEPLSIEAMEVALILAEEAANLVPEDADLWRLVHGIAALAEREDSRFRALEKIVALDPADEVARLKWVAHQVGQHQTVEDRAAALERLLSPESRRRLGAAVSSRLAMDLAMLERRRGEDERFADRLAQAVALDPSNHHAASLAAGYFQMHVDDPVAEAELLVQLAVANPVSVENAVLLAAHLLGHGAYAGAERFYIMALRGHEAMHLAAPADLVADAAIAQFGRGDVEGAIRRLADRQRVANIQIQRQLQRARPDLSPRERMSHVGGLTPTFASVRAAIHRRAKLDATLQTSLAAVAYDQAVAQVAEAENIDQADRDRHTALLRMEQAWVLVWLGGEIERVDEALEAARAIAAISHTAERRFDGWKAMRRGDHEAAVDVLQEIAEEDAPARLGLGLALIEVGRPRDGARELLAVARQQPGTLIGVYAADVLAEVLGRRAPLSTEAAELNALAANFPRALDRVLSEPTTAIGFSIVPEQPRYSPHAPLIVNVEIMNHAPVPLAIDPSGPIQPEIVILPSIQVVRARSGAAPPIVVGIDRRLRLMPGERLVIPVDIRRTPLGEALDHVAIRGAIVRLRGILNFRAQPDGSIVPDLLGSESRPPSIWIEGARLSQEWVDESLAALKDFSQSEEDLTRLALFGMAVAGDVPAQLPAGARRVLDEARQVVIEGFARAGPPGQAWLLAVWPSAFLDAIAPVSRYADDRIVHLAHLLFRVRDPNDPMITAALRSDDPVLHRVASIVRQMATGEDDAALFGRPDLTGE